MGAWAPRRPSFGAQLVVLTLAGCGSSAQPSADMAACSSCGDMAAGLGTGDLAPQCRDDSTCPASAPVCSAGKCSSCALTADGGSSGACSTYHAATNPPTPLCGPSGGCVQCLGKDDCAATNQTCVLATNTCGPCTKHSDCSTGVCKSGGVCAAPGEVAYVNNSATAGCSDLSHVSTPAAPYCKIGDVTMFSPSLRYIVVAPSATSYDAISLTATLAAIGPLTIIGPGHNATVTAKITPATGPAVSVATSGSPAAVTIDGLELIGAGGGSPAAGAKCQVITSGTPTLTILNSYLHGSGLYGVDSSSCALTLDANIISQNSGGGVSVNGCEFRKFCPV